MARIIADKSPALFFGDGGTELPEPKRSSIVFLKSFDRNDLFL